MFNAIFFCLLVNTLLAEVKNEELVSDYKNNLHRFKLVEIEDLSTMDGQEILDTLTNKTLECITEQLQNFTIDYDVLEMDEDCMQELNECTRLIALFAAVENFGKYMDALREDIFDDFKFLSQYYSLLDCDVGYDEYFAALQYYHSYLSELQGELQNLDDEVITEVMCPSNWTCGCLPRDNVDSYGEKLTEMSKEIEVIESYLIFGIHVDPVIRFFIIIFGLTLNITFLAIFLQHKYMRDNDNTMIYNILINNVLILVLYLPLQYIHYFFPNSISQNEGNSGYSFFEAIETMLISVSTFSLMMLSFQRYLHISKEINHSFSSSRMMRTTLRSYLYSVSPVWITAFFVSYFVCFFNNVFKDSSCVLKCSLCCVIFIVYIGIIPTAAIMNNIYTTDLLHKLTEDRRKYLEHQHITSTTVIRAMVASFWITHIPIFVWLLDYVFHFLTLDINNINSYTSIEMVTAYFVSSYACVTPTIFLLRLHYLYQCWYKLDKEPYKAFL